MHQENQDTEEIEEMIITTSTVEAIRVMIAINKPDIDRVVIRDHFQKIHEKARRGQLAFGEMIENLFSYVGSFDNCCLKANKERVKFSLYCVLARELEEKKILTTVKQEKEVTNLDLTVAHRHFPYQIRIRGRFSSDKSLFCHWERIIIPKCYQGRLPVVASLLDGFLDEYVPFNRGVSHQMPNPMMIAVGYAADYRVAQAALHGLPRGECSSELSIARRLAQERVNTLSAQFDNKLEEVHRVKQAKQHALAHQT